MAYFDTTWYVNFGDGATTGYYAVAKRPQNAAVAAGQIVRQFTAPAAGNERVYICVVAGTTANTTDATWTITRGVRITDGTAVWQECSGQAAINGDLTNTATWAQARALSVNTSVGQIIKRSNGASYQICNAAGATMGASEPAFSDTAGVTTTDNTAVWTSLGPVSNFTGGQAPHARLTNALASTWFASGNTVYVGNNHAETGTVQVAVSSASALMAKILCHNRLGSYPPAASDITTGATLTSTSIGVNINGQGSFYFYGLTFRTPQNVMNIGAASVGQVQNWYYFDNCSIEATNVGGSAAFYVGGTSTAWSIVVFNNTTVKFASVNQCLSPYFVNFTWQNTGQILAAGSSVPLALFRADLTAGRFSNITLNNLDLSQLTGSLFTNASNSSIGTLVVQDCKLNAAMTVTTPINTGMNVQLIRSDSVGTSYKSTRYNYEGTETTETSIVRTDGAVDPTGQAQSRKIVTSANAQWLRPFKAEPMVIWNPITGADVTATVYGTVNAGALPNNDDLWLECEYLGSATDPLGKIVTTTKASVLASNAAVSSDSSVWNSLPLTTMDGVITAGWALSNGGLTCTHTTNSASQGVASSTYLSGGKYYFECTLVAWGSNSEDMGVLSPTDVVSASIYGPMIRFGSGSTFVYSGGVSTGKNLGATAIGNVFGVAVDLDADLAWFRKGSGNWNGDAAANPVTGVGGVAVITGSGAAPSVAPFIRSAATSTINDAVTFNFGQSAYVNTPPSGFGNWFGWTPFKLTATLSSPQPQLPGYLHARVRAAKVSTTYYIDPKVELT